MVTPETTGPPDNMSCEEAWIAGWRRYSRLRWWARPLWSMGNMLMDFICRRGFIVTWRKEV